MTTVRLPFQRYVKHVLILLSSLTCPRPRDLRVAFIWCHVNGIRIAGQAGRLNFAATYRTMEAYSSHTPPPDPTVKDAPPIPDHWKIGDGTRFPRFTDVLFIGVGSSLHRGPQR